MSATVVQTCGVYLIRGLYQTKLNRLLMRTKANYSDVRNARPWGSLLLLRFLLRRMSDVPPVLFCASSSYDILTLLSLLLELLLMRNYDVRLKVFYTKTPFLTSDEKLRGVLCLQ